MGGIDLVVTSIMAMKRWGILLLLGGLTCAGSAAGQQQQPGRPVRLVFTQPANAPSHIPIPGDPGDLASLEQRLRQARGQGELRQMAEEVLKDPGKYGELLHNWKPGGKLDDQQIRALAEKILQDQAGQKPLINLKRDELERLRDAWEAAGLGPSPSVPRPEVPGSPPSTRPSATPPSAAPPAPAALPRPDAVRVEDRAAALEQLRTWAQFLEKWDGPWKDSPTLRRVVADMARFALGGDRNGGDPESLDVQLARLNQFGRQMEGWWQSAQDLGNRLNLGRFDGWNLSGRLPHLPGRSLPLPRVPETPSAEGMTALLWVLVLGLLGLVAWRLWQLGKKGPWRRLALWQIGPWPVSPDAINSRADLVKGFEYLSLRDFGLDARFRTHHDLAARLGGDSPERRLAATELAYLYEQARYAPAEETLSAEDLAVAGHHLSFLAGVSSA